MRPLHPICGARSRPNVSVSSRRGCARAGWRLCLVLAGLLAADRIGVAEAQGSAATIEVRLAATEDAGVAVRMQLLSARDPSQSWSAELSRGESVQFRLM